MTAKIKQRVVGIAVLLFLALIIIPWLFGNDQHTAFEDRMNQAKYAKEDSPEILKEQKVAAPAKPVPDNFEEVNNSPTEQQSAVITQPAKTNKPSTVAIKKEVDHEAFTASEEDEQESYKPAPSKVVQEPDTIKIAKIENRIVHTTQTGPKEPVAKKEPKEKTASVAAKKPKAAKKQPPEIALEVPHSAKNWAIQLGSFSNKTNVDNLVTKLKANGYSTFVKTSKKAEGQVITRVYVGPEQQRQTLESKLDKIEKLFSVKGVITKANP